MTAVQDVLARLRISDVCAELTGKAPQHGRIPAPWRQTRDRNVSVNDAKGTWFDHVSGQGGGILDLVQQIRGGSRADALRWCADLAGVLLDDKPLSAPDRARWARERHELEAHLPAARYWRRAALAMAEETAVELKAGLFDPTSRTPKVGEIFEMEQFLGRLRGLDGFGLVSEYRSWVKRSPALTAGMVQAAKGWERAERRALLVYLRQSEPPAREAAA